jgi:hypothetical protein
MRKNFSGKTGNDLPDKSDGKRRADCLEPCDQPDVS